MNIISRIVLGLLIFNILALTVVPYKVIKSDNKKENINFIASGKTNSFTPNNSNIKAKQAIDYKDSIYSNTIQNTSLVGIDISHWNGNIIEDLPKIDKLNFVICKSTQGERDIDPDFIKNWKFLTVNNITKGAYHFYMYTQDPVQQASHFYNTVGATKSPDFPLIIDIEELSLPKKYIDNKRLKNDLLKFLQWIEHKTNTTPIIYSDYYFLSKYLNDKAFSKYPLWLAEYSHNPKPLIPEAWKESGCMIWQKTDNYHINSSETDLDVYFK